MCIAPDFIIKFTCVMSTPTKYSRTAFAVRLYFILRNGVGSDMIPPCGTGFPESLRLGGSRLGRWFKSSHSDSNPQKTFRILRIFCIFTSNYDCATCHDPSLYHRQDKKRVSAHNCKPVFLCLAYYYLTVFPAFTCSIISASSLSHSSSV